MKLFTNYFLYTHSADREFIWFDLYQLMRKVFVEVGRVTETPLKTKYILVILKLTALTLTKNLAAYFSS